MKKKPARTRQSFQSSSLQVQKPTKQTKRQSKKIHLTILVFSLWLLLYTKFRVFYKLENKQTPQTQCVHFKDLYSSVLFHTTVRAGSISSTLCSGLLWCPIPPDTGTHNPPWEHSAPLGIHWHVDTSLESWVCQLQARKIDYFDHKRCICMSEFLIVANAVKSGSTKQSKEMD